MGLDGEKKEPGEGGEWDWSGHQKNKKVSEGHSLTHVASSTQRGKDGGEKGLVPPTFHGGLGWLQASWTR